MTIISNKALCIQAAAVLMISIAPLTVQRQLVQPDARIYHLMVNDPVSGHVFLFSGSTRHAWENDLSDSWRYDPKQNRWEEGAAVEAGQVFAAAYDSESDRVVMLNMKGETWTYAPRSDHWQKMRPPEAPSGRCGHRMVYDSESDRIILFGGFKCTDVSDPHYADTWSYDVNADRWEKTGAKNPPPARIYHGMAYDSEADRVIVWGGRVDDDDVWSYDFDQNTWANLDNENGPMGIRAYHSFTYDQKLDRIIVFGGLELDAPMSFGGSLLDEIWTYDTDENTWQLLRMETSPSKRSHHAMVFDRQTGMHVLFGGELVAPYSNSLSAETWLYDAATNRWKQQTQTE